MPSLPSWRTWHLSRRSWPLSIRPYRSGVKLSTYISSMDTYRSPSARYRLSRRNYRPQPCASMTRDNGTPSPAWVSQDIDAPTHIGLYLSHRIGPTLLNWSVLTQCTLICHYIDWTESVWFRFRMERSSVLSKLSLYYRSYHCKSIICVWCFII